MSSVKRVADSMVYVSVALGVALLYSAYGLVPAWLFAALTGGEVAYAAAAFAVARGYRGAYYAVVVLAVVTLAASLPQPEHYAFASEGDVVQFAIFALGSVLQLCIIVMVPLHLRRSGRAAAAPAE